MSSLKGKFTRIVGSYSESRILPRLGKIRLGVKVERVGAKGTVQFPRETEHFVCPPEVEAVYGPDPMELDVLLPSDDPEVVFQQKLVMYGASAGVKCHGNGREAERMNEQTRQFEPCVCPCPFLKSTENPKGQCTEKSSLMVILPTVSMGGCYQITTSSFHSTRNINSSLDMTKAVAGRIALLPMKLRRVPQETHHDGKKQIHYVLNLVLNASWQQLADLRMNPSSILIPSQYQIEAPADENPMLDNADVHEVEAEDLADASDSQLADIQAKLKELHQAKEPAGGAAKPMQDTPAGGAPPVQDPFSLDQHASIFPQRLPDGPVSQPDWDGVLAFIRNEANLNDLMARWTQENKVKNVSLMTDKGHQALLSVMRAQVLAEFPY